MPEPIWQTLPPKDARWCAHGEQITLRLLRPDDVTPAYVAWMNDPAINQYLESRWTVQTLASVREFVAAMWDSPTDYLFGMFWQANQRHVGNIKLGHVHPRHGVAEVGLVVGDPQVWGKGIGTEAIRLATAYGFEQLRLNKLTAGAYEPNQGSRKAFLKAGYREVGWYHRHRRCDDGRYVDEVLLERLNPAGPPG